MRQSLEDFCRKNGQSQLLESWDAEKNAPLTPSGVSPGSHRAVWWRCEKGHSWQTQINTRVAGCGCPVCAGRTVLSEENSLAVLAPELTKEWDREKNGELTPSQVTCGTRRKVWWKCARGHSWCASVVSRTRHGSGCPVCTGRTVLPGFNDLASRSPAIAREWDAEKNAPLTPQSVSVCSNRKVWWRCPLGHGYQALISTRTMRNTGCPVCAGRKVLSGFNDLSTLEPLVAAQWHPTLNAPLTPADVTPGSHRIVWWKCPQGHIWKAVICSRTGRQSNGCPVCAGRFNETRRLRYDRLIKEAMERGG